MPDDADRYSALVERNVIEFPTDLPDTAVAGQRFVIKTVNEVRRGKAVTKAVEAHHIAYDLNRYFLDDYVDFSANQPPSYPLSLIGNNTPYTMAVVGTFENRDIFEFGENQKYTLLSEIATLYGGELAFDNETITLTTRRGGNYGVEIRYAKNLAGITRQSSELERVTRLYGYGKNGLTIEGHGGRTVKYIDSAYIDPSHIYEGSMSFPEIDDKVKLLEAMQKHLATVELPHVTYDVDFVQLEKTEGGTASDVIRGVGDTITVIDEDIGYNFTARVTEYDRYPFEPKKARVKLANFREMTAADYVTEALYSGKKAIVYTSKNAVLKGVKYDDSITLVDGMGMAVSDDLNRVRVRLGQVAAGEYGLTAYNKAGQRTFWLDADNGNAQFAGDIRGGNIYGANFTTNAGNFPRVEITSGSNLLRAYKSGGSYIEIDANPATYSSAALKFVSDSVVTEHGIFAGGYYIGVSGGSLSLSSASSMHLAATTTTFANSTNAWFTSDVYIGGTLSLNSTNNLQFGVQSMSSILSSIYSRLSSLESALI